MLEVLLATNRKRSSVPDIVFKVNASASITVDSASLGGFGLRYSVNNGEYQVVGSTLTIPAGVQEVALLLSDQEGKTLNMTPFAGRLTEVVDWGGLRTSSIVFTGCTNLVKVPTYLPDSFISLSSTFRGCSRFNQDINSWDTRNISNMSILFYECVAFNQSLSTWDTSSVTDMSFMFHNCSIFNQSLTNFNTNKVTKMNYMLSACPLFNGDLSGWDTTSVTDMSFMFMNDTSFNRNISSWKVPLVTDITSMFNNCRVFNQDLSSMVFRSSTTRNYYDYSATSWSASYRPKFTG